MLLFLAVCSGAAGLGWLHPLDSIGATLLSPGSAGGVASVLVGVILHAAVSAGFGVVFAMVLPDDFPLGSSAVVGGAYGLVAAATMTALVIPAVSPDFRTAIQPVGGSWTIGHVIFGSTLGLAVALRYRAARSMAREVAGLARTASPNV